MIKECLQCESKKDLEIIKNTHSQYDGLYICKNCIQENESLLCYDDFYNENGLKIR